MSKKTTNEATAGRTIQVDGGADMAAFDELPKMLRDALNYAPGPYSAVAARREMRLWGSGSARADLYLAAEETYGVRQDGLQHFRPRRRRRL